MKGRRNGGGRKGRRSEKTYDRLSEDTGHLGETETVGARAVLVVDPHLPASEE